MHISQTLRLACWTTNCALQCPMRRWFIEFRTCITHLSLVWSRARTACTQLELPSPAHVACYRGYPQSPVKILPPPIRVLSRGWHATGAMFCGFHLAFYLCGPQAGSVASMGIGKRQIYTTDPSRVSGAPQLTMTEAGKDCRIVHVGATLGLIGYQW